jgi:hypothetical protein
MTRVVTEGNAAVEVLREAECMSETAVHLMARQLFASASAISASESIDRSPSKSVTLGRSNSALYESLIERVSKQGIKHGNRKQRAQVIGRWVIAFVAVPVVPNHLHRRGHPHADVTAAAALSRGNRGAR